MLICFIDTGVYSNQIYDNTIEVKEIMYLWMTNHSSTCILLRIFKQGHQRLFISTY